jgi:uncharacterized membrane protein YgdD (TMEM256/DUF423 family)
MNWIKLAALFGFLGVALGAFGAHGLKEVLSPYHMDIYKTAVFYHLIHTVALLGYGILAKQSPTKAWPGVCFSLGIVVFSGSLYLLAITGIGWLGAVTPIGGLFFLAGWIGTYFTAK